MSVCVCLCVYDNSKINGSFNWQLEHFAEYGNSSDEVMLGRFSNNYVHRLSINKIFSNVTLE